MGGPTEKLEGRGSLGEMVRRTTGFFSRGGAMGAGGRAIAVGSTNGQDSRENGNDLGVDL